MAVIGSIRKRSGLLIVIIGIALAAFVLGDLLSSNRQGGRSVSNVGSIAGKQINPMDFDRKVKINLELAQENSKTGEQLTTEEQYDVRQSTWENLVKETLMEKEYDNLGLALTSDELFDRVQGSNPHPIIKQYFSNPATGQFDPANVLRFLKNLESEEMDPETRKQWKQLETYIKESSLLEKYNNIIANSYYVPNALAKYEYDTRGKKATCTVLGVKYNNITDSEAAITDKDYQNYYNNHKADFKQEKSCDIEYVLFPIVPSEEDLINQKKQIDGIFQEFEKTPIEEIANFVNSVSDNYYDSTFFKEGTLPVRVEQELFNAEPGKMLPTYKHNDAFHMAKLLDVQYRPDSMRASHILIAYQGALRVAETVVRDKEKAESLADSLLNVVKRNSRKFETIAKDFSDGPSGAKGGDLEWFADGTMVHPFNQAVINGRIGSITKVESPFGFHIIKITGKQKEIRKVRVAMIDRSIDASNVTYQRIYNQASLFAAENRTYEDFDAAIKKQGLSKRIVPTLKLMDNMITGLSNPREIIRWAFDENSEKGVVSSDIFQMDEGYVVASIQEKYVDGVQSLETVKETMKYLVIREKKAKMLIADIQKQLDEGKNLQDIAQKYNTKIDSLSSFTQATSNIVGFGREPGIVGNIFSLETGQTSKPLQGNTAIFLIKPEKIEDPTPSNDFTNDKQRAELQFVSRVNNEAFKALKKASEIEDNRLLFY